MLGLRKTFVISSLVLCSVASCASANVTSLAPKEYLCWLDELKRDMHQKGISQKTLDEVYVQDYYHPNPEVVKIDRKQIEFALTATDYINRVVNKKRVEKARDNYKKLKPLLDKVAEKYGVPPQYLMAFWGVETNFGSNFGGFNVIAALTMLSYDKRRPEFFKNELFEALKIVDDWQIDYTTMQGSWAGAMGHFQFMPSTFNTYAVDFDSDKKIDIWHSFEDAVASAANYLGKMGWKKDEPWGLKVSLPWNFDFSLSGRNKTKEIAEWHRLGVRTQDNKKIKLDPKIKASIIVPEGQKGAAYLILDNFNIIMKWNRSENYALAIGLLADYVKNNNEWKPVYKHPATRLKTDDILKIQSFINKIGWFKLDEDGQLGSKTREAVKKVQKEAKMPQDGYPDYRLLQKIRNYNPKIGFSVPVPERKLHKQN